MIINGRQLAGDIILGLKKELKSCNLKITAIAVGNSEASLSFLKQKQKIAKEIGVAMEIIQLLESTSQEDLINTILKLNQDEASSGIILQLPLPAKFNAEEALDTISPKKDIDGLSKNAIVLPPAASVVEFILKEYDVELENKKIVVVGQGRLVGKPIGEWLSQKQAEFSFIEKQTPEVERQDLIKKSDILISGVGKANLIPADLFKPDAVVIDFGFDKRNNQICGDIEQKVGDKVTLFTPTPNGTGPILVAMIFNNLFKLQNND